MEGELKRLVFDGRELQYALTYDSDNDVVKTTFYEGIETILVKKWIFFGETITIEKPKEVFKFWNVNIESCNLTKKYVRDLIQTQLHLLERCDEIKRGEII